jgi:hypothetical protein
VNLLTGRKRYRKLSIIKPKYSFILQAKRARANLKALDGSADSLNISLRTIREQVQTSKLFALFHKKI